MMERQPIESSNLQDAGFDADSGVLEVTFKNGKRWRYFGITGSTFAEFMEADSQGSFFARNIRGQFEGEPVEEDDAS